MASSTVEAAAALLANRSADDAAGVLGEAMAAPNAAAEPAQPQVPSSPPPAAAPDPAHEAAPDQDGDEPFQLGEPEPLDADWLEPPDDEDDEPPAAAIATTPTDDDDEYSDPEVKQLRAELAAARKRAEHFEKQNAKTARKGWAKEAGKYYPLADPDSITATSRRSFMRDAKAQHERLIPQFRRFEEAEKVRLRARAAEQWGPAVAAGQVPSNPEQLEAKLATMRKQGVPLGRRFREMIG